MPLPRRVTRSRLGPLLLALALPLVGGCDLVKKLREVFHGPDTAEEFGNAGLRVEVDPPDGISILLDGVRVASLSPYAGKNLKAGPRTLEVRAMGYHAFVLPIELKDGETLDVPVSLRRRDDEAPATTVKATPRKEKAPALPPPEAPAAALPTGVQAITLDVVPQPRAEINLDGIPTDGKGLQLARVTGVLQIGEMRLSYRIGGAGLLIFTPASDGAAWTRDGGKMKEGGFRLNRGVTRVRREADDDMQSALFRRN